MMYLLLFVCWAMFALPISPDELQEYDPLGYALIEQARSVDPVEYMKQQPKPQWVSEAAEDDDGEEAAAIDLLIIAPREFSESVQSYVQFKTGSLATEFITLEDILEDTEGVDDPERIKRYLFDRWKRRHVRYVLLVGDADVLPVRYMVLDRNTDAAFNYAFYPSDLYYGDLANEDGTFEDWNARKDGFHAQYFGEVRGEHNKRDPINFDQIDYRPEIAVGRWPVSSAQEVTTLVKKSIGYAESLKNVDEDESPTAAFIACGGWIENRGMMDHNAKALEDRFTIEKRYFTNARRDDDTPPPNAEEVVKLMNAGARFIFHSGHGTSDGWHESLHLNDLDKIENAEHLPIVISAGCSTARFASLGPYEAYVDVTDVEHKGTDQGEVFEEPPPPPAPYQKGEFNHTGLGEQLLRSGPDGAVAYIGCNTGSQPCGMTLMRGFANAIGSSPDDIRLGDAWNAAIRYYYDTENLGTIKPTESWYPASIFFQGMKFMLFGDPSLPLPR